MKKILLSRLFFTIIFSCSFYALSGQAVLVENFEYTAGSNLTSNGWVAHSGGGTQPVTVNLSGLTFSGYPGSGIGLSALIDNNGEDVHKTFSPVSSGSVYCSFLVNVTTVAAGYFFHLNDNPIGTTFRAKVFLDGTGSNFNFGLSKGSNTPTLTAGAPYTTGTTYLIVIKYNIIAGGSNDEVSMFVFNSTIPGTEPGTPTIGPLSDAAQSDLANVASVALRQYIATQNLTIDGIRISTSWTDAISDVFAPSATFDPANASTGILVNVKPVITFNESIRKTNGGELTDGDLAALLSFKKTNASGADVPFTATIDATKKIITVTPSANLDNAQLYYLSVGPVEDIIGNESLSQSATFTTISAVTPLINVTYPAGGEVMYSGEIKVITWTSSNFDVAETVKIEVYVPTEAGPYEWIELIASTPNDGEHQANVGPEADYGTGYIIRITGVTNGATDSSNPFTVIATATTLTGLREYINGTIIRYDGEAIITFIRTDNRNQKYLQDVGAGLLIDDAAGILTTTLNQGDKIKFLEGTLGAFNGVLQLVPTKASVTVVSSGNTVTPIPLTLIDFKNNYGSYESRLVRLSNVTFLGADGTATFAASSNYNLTDGTNTLQFRTFRATESNIVGTVIPTQTLNLTGIGGENNATPQIYSRTTADFSIITGIDRNTFNNLVVYPVPAVNELNIRNLPEVTGIEILDVTGKIVLRYTDGFDSEIKIIVAGLRKGIYFLKITTPTGKIVRRFIKS